MKIDKFTTGPWRSEVNPSNPKQWIVLAATHETVVHSVAGGKDHAESNARLIAAAPEMYAALKAWEHWYSSDSTEFNRDTAQGDGLKALAKADGVQP